MEKFFEAPEPKATSADKEDLGDDEVLTDKLDVDDDKEIAVSNTPDDKKEAEPSPESDTPVDSTNEDSATA